MLDGLKNKMMDKEIVAKTINEENQRCKNMNYDEMGKGYSHKNSRKTTYIPFFEEVYVVVP